MEYCRIHLLVQYALLCSHLITYQLPDADVGAAKHLSHILCGVQGEAESAPDVRSDG